jgi:DTW domain-containing protein YfiP
VCLRPQRTCLCQWVTPVAHATEVLILQHPLEALHAKNTARLLHLSLAHSCLVVGEVWEPAALASPRFSVLLYPKDAAHPAHPAFPSGTDHVHPPWPAPAQLRLVVLDATWRKSRKMLHLNPWLQALPRLSLDSAAPSAYRIRKAHKTGQLSTLEATCAALAQLEGSAAQVQPLLLALDGYVEKFRCFLPSSA